MAVSSSELQGWRIAIPESRQLDVLSNMLTTRGAQVDRCPLVAIYDNPKQSDIHAWLKAFIAHPADDFVMFTGEGVKRLTRSADSIGLKQAWADALSKTRKIARGPKPSRALKELDLKPDVTLENARTEGIIDFYRLPENQGRDLAIQLYGQDPNDKLQGFLKSQGFSYQVVFPYIYAPDSESTAVESLIARILNSDVDIFVFTSMQQVSRLEKIAKKTGSYDALWAKLNSIIIAAVGPVVADALTDKGVEVSFQPESKFFMKPLVRKIVEYCETNKA